MRNRWRIGILLLVCLCFLLPLAIYAYLGVFNRWIADDYCEAAYVKTGGIFIGSIMLYISWTGRFFASLLGTFLTTLGPGAARFVPGAVLAVWLVVLVIALYQIALTPGRLMRLLSSIFLALVVLSTTVQLSPKVDQPLFWEQAMSDSIPALVLGTLYASLVVHFRRENKHLLHRRWYILYFCLAFIAGGISETYATAQLAAFFMLILGAILWASSVDIGESLPWMLAGFLGSFFALVLNLAAPGNIGHQHLYAPVPGAGGLMKITLASMSLLVSKILTNPLGLFSVISLLGISLLTGAGLIFDLRPLTLTRRGIRLALIALPAITLILLLACLVPAAYGQSTPPPDRTLIVPYYLLVCALAVWGYLAGRYLRQVNIAKVSFHLDQRLWNVLAGCLMLLFAINSIAAAAQIMRLHPSISQFAAAWDRSHALIIDAKARGLAHVTVPPFPNWAGIEDISPDPNFWVNRCASVYYGIVVQTQ